ncbi:MAG: CDP-2,3-bis-(O-geranylgeranyl)-sn-glycerol synthase [Crenarchaeota archaeon]|nr:CDP-2,3-bis-(O-geranylgeranyl)-sn-glycerol synthase [Thermoproteota archaeon]
MEIAVLIGEALKFIFPAYCANGAPVIGGGGCPLDFGKNFYDGKRIFGANKTFRGFFFGLSIGFLVGLVETLVFGFSIWLAVLAPLGALLGDLTGAFLKRRLNIPPGGMLPIVDQIDFVVGALVFTWPLGIITWQIALLVLLITPPVHLFTNFLAYKMKLKKNPW